MIILNTNLRRIFGIKVNILFMLVIPIVVNIFVVSLSTQVAKYNLGIMDNDNTSFTKEFISMLESQGRVTLMNSGDNIHNLLLNRKLDCVFAIDAGFTKDLIDGKEVKVKSYALDDTNQSEPIETSVSSYLAAVKNIAAASNKNEAAFYDGLKIYNESKYKVEYKNFASSYKEDIKTATSSLGYLAFAMLLLVTFSTSLLLNDRLKGIYNRILVTPIRQSGYYIQHMLSYFIVAIIQVIVLITVLPKIANVNYGKTPGDVIMLIGVCCIFALVCISIGLFINLFSKNTLTAGALNTLIVMPMLMISGCLWPKELMPGYLQKIGSLMPTSWFLNASESIINGQNIWDVKNEILYMLVFVIILSFIALAIRSETFKFLSFRTHGRQGGISGRGL